MSYAALETTEKKHDLPILIVDEKGIIGQALVNELKQESLIVFVSQKKVEDRNVVCIPFSKKIPSIPDNTYSHVFIVDQDAKISNQFISSFIKKAQHDQSNLVLILDKNLVSSEFAYNFISSYEKAKIVLIGDVFANNIIYDQKTILNKFINSARRNGKIDVPNDGTALISPVYFEDLILGILQTGFIEKSESKIYFLYPKEKFTLLSVAHMLQKKEPNLKIDFRREEYKQEKEISLDGVYLLEENYNLEARIKKIDLESEKESKEKVIKKDRLNTRFKIAPILIGTSLTIIFFFILPLFSTFFFAVSGAFYLNNLKNSIETVDLNSAKTSAFFSYNLFSLSKSSFSLLEREAQFLGAQNKLEDISLKIDQGQELSLTALKILDSLDKIKNIALGSSKNPNNDFQSTIDNLKQSLVSYQKEVNNNIIPESINNKIKDIIYFSSTTIDLWPDILGFNGEKSYLVLFENSMELRPGGGFIGSYAILTLDKAKISDFKIYDVYDADGQLKNHVEPPFAIRRYLPSVNWYLRDSNYDVDFSKNAVSAAVFLNSEMHKSVDGVIAVDLSFVKKILSKIGPVKVDDYNTIITSDNLFKVTESKAQDKFFPGSTQKKNFLSSLFNAINYKISQQKDVSYLGLMQALVDSINEKHVIFAFNNLSLQSVFSVNGWGSTLFDNRASDDSTINDFVGISEANLGANKVNYYIGRSVSQTVEITNDGTTKEALSINFKNNADKSLGSNGIYKNYLRVILPFGATVNEIKINDNIQKIVNAITDPALYEAKKFVPPSGLELEKYNEGGKSIFGFLVLVNPGQLKSISISYTLINKLNLTTPQITYNQKLFKQPGIDSFPYSFSISYPQNFNTVKIPINSQEAENKISLSKDAISDLDFSITLVKK